MWEAYDNNLPYFCFSNSLLDDPDTQVTMKTLGLMRNLLSGREVLLLFGIRWGSPGYGSGGGKFAFLSRKVTYSS